MAQLFSPVAARGCLQGAIELASSEDLSECRLNPALHHHLAAVFSSAPLRIPRAMMCPTCPCTTLPPRFRAADLPGDLLLWTMFEALERGAAGHPELMDPFGRTPLTAAMGWEVCGSC